MNQIERDLDSPVPTDFDEQQKLPDDVLEALGAGRLTDINYLGSGATSSVFSAHDSGLDKRVAIKFLKHGNDGRLIDFQSEAKLASQLSHGNLVKILNFGVTTKNHAFLIMDLRRERTDSTEDCSPAAHADLRRIGACTFQENCAP